MRFNVLLSGTPHPSKTERVAPDFSRPLGREKSWIRRSPSLAEGRCLSSPPRREQLPETQEDRKRRRAISAPISTLFAIAARNDEFIATEIGWRGRWPDMSRPGQFDRRKAGHCRPDGTTLPRPVLSPGLSDRFPRRFGFRSRPIKRKLG